ncbi:RNA polymerase sigma factor (sigma-70 family) [Microbacterium trichothecenolyticum]|uniref:RNA polymerase sigma factor n=1 Tax=Microbacterium trichothecenolyticum TaxID=69370 RepID=UPI00285B0362|nr:sigma-70 family RNA polymerase sigma factor [Microbacterium trichothecenolyticum]MDR7184169.1 RNA polymerase sigma factor (sigma-70 family) [Microbacterium trichothecenolyticum]
MTSDGDAHARRAVEAVWRDESARIVSALTRHTGDFAWAEDLAQEALVEALAAWPVSGIPDNPGAWLMSVAKRRAIDGWRRRERMSQREPLFVSEALVAEAMDSVPDDADPDRIDDDVLRLVFVACHPVLPAQARLALTLRTVAGLTTEQIARALLMTVPTVQQRIVRAKRTLTAESVPFEVPDRAERPARLASVLQVIYLLFTEGYSAAEGEGLIRPDVAREAVRLGRQLAALIPRESEIWSLIALMEFQSSRFAARIDADGLPVTLEDQDRRRWDRSAIARGLEAMGRAVPTAPPRAAGASRGASGRVGPAPTRGLGYYGLQAAIAQCHAIAPSFGETDWEQILRLYDALESLAPSAVVRLNRAVALSMARGPEPALAVVDALEPELSGFRPLPAVRAELLERLGRTDAAAAAFLAAAALPGNAAEAEALRRRAEALGRL